MPYTRHVSDNEIILNMHAHEWRLWFENQIGQRSEPKREIPAGKYCRYCNKCGYHAINCRNPWDILDDKWKWD